ncbi:type IV pilin, partial [Thermoplasmatota archaeon]
MSLFKINIDNEESVSEILGTLLLLIIAVIVISAIIISVISSINDNPKSEIDLVGRLEDGVIIIEHQGGETLDEKSRFILYAAGNYLDPVDINLSDPSIHITNSEDNEALADGWNVGEILSYKIPNYNPIYSYDNRIVDDFSEDLVFYVKYSGLEISNLGGIWHFDEGKGYIANDSLNSNDGSLSDNSSWILNNTKISNSFNFISAAGDASINFSGLKNRIVTVPNDISLVFSKNITIKASIWPTEIRSFIDKYEIEEVKFGQTPHIVKVSDNLIGVAMENQSKGGALVSIGLDDFGLIDGVINQSIFLNKSSRKWPVQPNIINLNNDLFVLAHHNTTVDEIIIKTLYILPDGEISNTSESFNFKEEATIVAATPTKEFPNKPQLAKINDNTIAVVFCDNKYNGIIYTFNIASDGVITELFHERIDTGFYDPSLAYLNSDVIIVSYWHERNPTKGAIRPISISSLGEITVHNLKYIDDIEVLDSSLLRIDNDTMVLCYNNNSKKGEGMLITFNVSSTMNVEFSNELKIYSYFEGFFNDEFYNPDICCIRDNLYGVVFSTGYSGTAFGYFFTIEINEDGIIESTGELELFEDKFCYFPIITGITDEIVGVVFEGFNAQTGILKTLYIEDENIPIDEKGFVKQGTYGFWANTNKIYVWVNDQILSLPVNKNIWNNIVMTYDSEDERLIRFYNNYDPETDGIITEGNNANYNESIYDEPIIDLQ